MKKILNVIGAAWLGAASLTLVACGGELDGNLADTSPQTAEAALDEGPELDAATAWMAAPTDAFKPKGGGKKSKACREINARLMKDARALQKTPEFKTVAKTKEFKELQQDLIAMRRKGCSMGQPGGDFECLQLQLQAYQHQQALQATPSFKKMAKTKEYKTLEKDSKEAYDKGCLEGMGI